MSKLSIASPNYCSCTVNRARNLPDKGKGNGINTFCTISMGKEKFVTAVCEKTSTPSWNEQCDMPIADDATIKLTVYQSNKSSLSKGDFIGRAHVSLRDLQDYDRVHTNWYRLTNKDGKTDKDRGEIEVSLQFYSKNNTTGSVLDLATKKKHLSLRDIKQSLNDKLKSATKHRKNDKNGGGNQSTDPYRRSGGDDFLDDSASETTSFAGSQMSLNSMSHNNNSEQQKKKSRPPSSGLGSTMGTGTPHSSRRSITSDYDASSILDSASMQGGDEQSTSSLPARSQIQQQQQQQQQQQREVYVGDALPPRSNSTKKKAKEPLQSVTLPTIITTKPSSSPPPLSTNNSRSFFTTNDDIKSNSKSSTNKFKEPEIISSSESSFGLSTIKENVSSSKDRTDEDIDFDNYFNKIKPPPEEKKTKKSAPTAPQFKEQNRPILQHSNDIKTPASSISIKTDNTPKSTVTLPETKQNEKVSDGLDDSTDEDVDELLGKLERMSSMRSSARRKIQPRDDIVQQSYVETLSNGQNQRQPPFGNTTLPDIVGEQTVKSSSQRPTSGNTKKPVNNGLNVLGYENVKSTPINPKIRQELDYLDREELLHVITYQTDLLKKRDTRLKDLEHYTDGLLVKIVEQCPSILQVGSSSSASTKLSRFH